MIVMIGSHSGAWFDHFQSHEKARCELGWMLTAYDPSEKGPRPGVPFAIDNGCFSSWRNGERWKQDRFERCLDRMLRLSEERGTWPRFLVVPDMPRCPEGTLSEFYSHSRYLEGKGVDLAFAMQDGHSVEDVPEEADVVFLAGSDTYQRWMLEEVATTFDRVHLGRCNTLTKLQRCRRLGVESVDGTMWFRTPQHQERLARFLLEENRLPDPPLFI